MPANSSSYEPFTVQMLVLDGFLLWDSVQGAFTPFLLALVAVAAVAGAAERIAGRTVALLAAAVFGAQPLMLWRPRPRSSSSGSRARSPSPGGTSFASPVREIRPRSCSPASSPAPQRA